MDNIEIINLVPKFLDFFRRAQKENLDIETRWELWKEYYNFAAVPPGEEGMRIAKSLLEGAWEKYSKNIRYIENWNADHGIVEQSLKEIKYLLGYEKPINLVVIYFVGGFENNAFVAPYDQKRLALCLPIECGDSMITLSHELTHVVHSKTANLKANWERTIASTILQEGLATQVSKYVCPGEQDEKYIEHNLGWFDSCKSMRKEIIEGIRPYLDDSSSEAITKFTFGSGTTNHEREVYFVGWEIVTALLMQGVTLKEIASIQEEKIPDYIRERYSLLFS